MWPLMPTNAAPTTRRILSVNVENVKLSNNRPRNTTPGARRGGKFKKGNYAIRVRRNGQNTYYKPKTFNSMFGTNWRKLNKQSKQKIAHGTNIRRLNVKVVRFTS